MPTGGGSSGSTGYSSIASLTSVNSAAPHDSPIESGSDSNSAVPPARLRVISASSRPGTSALPGSVTSAFASNRAETS